MKFNDWELKFAHVLKLNIMNIIPKSLIIGLVLLLSHIIVYSQENTLKFTKQERFTDYKIVYFVLDRPITDIEFKDFRFSILSNSKIYEFNINDNISCQVKLDLDVSPEDIQKYLQQKGLNFSYQYVQKSNSENDVSFPTHYPQIIRTGNKMLDHKKFIDAEAKWKIKYLEEWAEYKSKNLIN